MFTPAKDTTPELLAATAEVDAAAIFVLAAEVLAAAAEVLIDDADTACVEVTWTVDVGLVLLEDGACVAAAVEAVPGTH